MDISNLDFATNKNSISKNKYDYKTNNQIKNGFSRILQEKSCEKSPSRPDEKHNIEYDWAKKKKDASSINENSDRKDVSAQENKHIEKKDDKDINDENTVPSEEKISMEELPESSSEKDKVSDAFLIECLNSMGIDLSNLNLEHEIKEKLKLLVQGLLVSDEQKVIMGNEKLNSLLSLLQKIEDAPLDSNLKSQITFLLKDNLSLAKSNINSEQLSGLTNIDSTFEKDLTQQITTKIKNILAGEYKPAEESMSTETSSNFKLLNNIFVAEQSENGVAENNLLLNSNLNKEDGILEKLIDGDKKDSKLDRLSNFMTSISDNRIQLNNVSTENKTFSLYVSKTNFNEDIIKSIRFMDVNSIKDLSVKIYPKELGEVFISVSMEQGTLKAIIKATNKDAVDMLNLGLRDINEKLNLNNIKIESVDIGLYKDDTTYFSNENFAQQQQSSQEFKENTTKQSTVALEEEQKTEDIVNDGTVNLLI